MAFREQVAPRVLSDSLFHVMFFQSPCLCLCNMFWAPYSKKSVGTVVWDTCCVSGMRSSHAAFQERVTNVCLCVTGGC